jgi:hypothetical protein
LDPELARIVDRGLHPQDGGLDVDLRPVAGHAGQLQIG